MSLVSDLDTLIDAFTFIVHGVRLSKCVALNC